jgi:(1->4)-alpha-D-glucan 1-alpha-D-glucosylmutase
MADVKIPQIPVATYRLQFRNGMTFDKAIELIPHLKSLGISHLYASPIFAAVTGSTHGYDVTDPNEIEPELGGIGGFGRLSNSLQAAGLGLILDIVPNHMAASLENPYWRDVLKWGQESRFAALFDNDWDQQLTLPVLDSSLEDVIEAGNGKLLWEHETGELVFDYCGSHYPLAPSTYPLAIPPSATAKEFEARDIIALLGKQPWHMVHWRDAAKGLSYRRFFEITGLVGVRVEDPDVFEATHRLVLDLVAEGRVQGLRVDHIDGLADPAAYLKRLRAAIGPHCCLVVEKILEGDEQLPTDWPVDGTTGYEFIADLAGLLTAESPALDRAWRDAAPDFGEPEQALGTAKRLIVEVNFEGEITALARMAQAVAKGEARGDLSYETLAEAVRAMMTGFDVYRTYGTALGLSDQDKRVLEELFARLRTSSPDLQPALTFLEESLFERVGEKSREAAITFRTRLQHLTGPVLAKSLEDTFFYRYNRLIALNEVGGDPLRSAAGVDHFHRRMKLRRKSQRHGLSATSTHDTKRGEEARARLYAISEAPEDWIAATARWRQRLAPNVMSLPDGPAPEPSVEWLIFQALAGMLPHDFDPSDPVARAEMQDRFLPYVEKALREAKLRTNWSDVHAGYEEAVKDYASAALGSDAFMTRFWDDIQPFVRTGLINSLTQTLIKLTAPGIPDIYQGSEGEDTSLVDPDNRRMPDFERLAARDEALSLDDFAATKTWLIRKGLALRRRHSDLFTLGNYAPLESSGEREANLVAFVRTHGSEAVIVVAPRLVHHAVSMSALLSGTFWGDTEVMLPDGIRSIRDALGNQKFPQADRIMIADLFRRQALALLHAEIG